MTHDHRPESEPFVSVRRIDGAYRTVVTFEYLEATHLVPLQHTEAWKLVARVAAAFAEGRDINQVHWDFEPVEWERRG